jgi:alanyl-tRNA synthetase
MKKKRQKVYKSLKKEGKRRKIEKKVTKSAQNNTPDTKTSFNVKMGNPSGAWIFAGENSGLKIRLVKMLK